MSPAFDNLPAVLQKIGVRPLFVLRLEVNPYEVPGATPGGFRRIGTVPGGSFDGLRLSGKVCEGGNDWQIIRTDNATTLDVRLLLRTNDDALIGMYYKGLRHGPFEAISRLDRGEEVDPSSYYFRINPLFETASPKYDWINRIMGIGVGWRRVNDVLYSVFELS